MKTEPFRNWFLQNITNVIGLIHLISGLIFIALGFLKRVYPGMISGYNTMLAEKKKKNIDIEGISRYIRDVMILLGLAIILLYLVFRWSG
jgi:hypothetical protein